MPRIAKELSALQINRLKGPGHHAVGGVSGLYLFVNNNGARSWVLRSVVGTRRRHMGLGPFPEVPLAQAKDKARQAKEDIANGIDPIAKRRAVKDALRMQQATEKTFAQAFDGYLQAHGDTWTNPKHRAQWQNTLQTYAYPVMGKLPVRDINQEHVLAVLEPIWKEKNETASRLRGRIEKVLDWATVRKYRTTENPARWKGHLDQLLAAPSKVQKVVHHKALPIKEIGPFMHALRQCDGIAAKALEYTILCAARSGEVRGAAWDEIDLQTGVWTIPAQRMKAKREHRVPLSQTAIELLQKQKINAHSDLVFPAPRGGQLSDMTLTAVLRRMGIDAVPHGFRSTFRDWAGDMTHHPRDMIEIALAHRLESKVEEAYRRSDALEKRRVIMQEWAALCNSGTSNK